MSLILSDHLGSSSILTDSQGNVTGLYDYYPFGGSRIEQVNAGTDSINRRYTGKELDQSTNLTYYGARYYEGATGRFTQQDPANFGVIPASFLKDPQQLNAYSYIRNNPVIYTDPDGRVIAVPLYLGYLGAVWVVSNLPAIETFVYGLWAGSVASSEYGASLGYTIEGDFSSAKQHSDNAMLACGSVGAVAGTNLAADSVNKKVQSKQSTNDGAKTQSETIKGNSGTQPVKVPKEARDMLKYVDENPGKTAPKGYKGGSVFENKDGLLPKQEKGYYKEWDVKPRTKGESRGTERLITGQNGEAWYTNDHYQTLTQIRNITE